MTADEALADLPLIAILRGLTPDRALDVAMVLHDAGVRAVEVPLNSPNPFETLRILARATRRPALFGAGTVLTVAEADQVAETGAGLLVSPNTNAAVIKTAIKHGMTVMPGVATPTE